MLTDKARSVYEFIVRYTQEQGYPPTIREVGKAFEFSSTNGTRHYLNMLEQAGYLKKRLKGKSRAIVPVFDGAVEGAATPRDRASRLSRSRVPARPVSAGIPILGRVAAGTLMGADEEIEGHLSLDEMFPASDDLFALRVRGLSMKDRGILDGDLVVVRKQEHARDGDAIVALVGGDATVKTYRRTADAVELVPENPDFQVLRVGPDDDFHVAGVVVGLVRPMGLQRRG
jgi:repressor LexA